MTFLAFCARGRALQSKLDRSSRVGDELKRKMETLGPEATILANSSAQVLHVTA
jgi:hypothetical protein